MRRQTIHNVQLLRFLAAGGVALSHVADLLVPNSPTNQWFWSIPWTAGVDLFFVISGFIMALLTHEHFGFPGAGIEFLKRRIIRIVPAYWFFTTLTIIAVLILGGRVRGTTIDLFQIVTSYCFIPWPRADGNINPILAQGWTLNYEAFFYVSLAIAMLIRRGLLALCIVFLLLALAHYFIPPEMFMARFWSNPIILEFLGGVLLAKIYLSGYRLPHWGSWVCAALAVTVFILTGYVNWENLSRAIGWGIPALFLSASLILSPEPKRLGSFRRIVQRGGDASYTIYLAHYMIIHVVVFIWQIFNLQAPWVGVAAAMFITIGASIIFFEIVEGPVTVSLQRRFGKSQSQTIGSAGAP